MQINNKSKDDVKVIGETLSSLFRTFKPIVHNYLLLLLFLLYTSPQAHICQEALHS